MLSAEQLIQTHPGRRQGATIVRPSIRSISRPASAFLYLQGVTYSEVYDARALLEVNGVYRLALARDPDTLYNLKNARHTLTSCHGGADFSSFFDQFFEGSLLPVIRIGELRFGYAE
jgi:DNA-binding FadR family transcriptional regulator